MPKPMMDLPMDTKNHACTCGGPPEFIETTCPECGEKGARVKVGTVRHLVRPEFKDAATDKIYGLCLSADCSIAWYAQDGSHHFTTGQTETRIWTKKDADPVMACYCNKITADMVREAVQEHNLRDMEAIIMHYRESMLSLCAVRNPMGKCCSDFFDELIEAAQNESP